MTEGDGAKNNKKKMTMLFLLTLDLASQPIVS